MQERGIRRPLVERQERDVRDPGEAIEGAADLSAGVDAQGAGAHLVDDDVGPRSRGESPEFGVIAHETTDAERVGRSDRDDDVRLV